MILVTFEDLSTHLVLVGVGQPLFSLVQKARGSVISNRIWVKFVRHVSESKYASSD